MGRRRVPGAKAVTRTRTAVGRERVLAAEETFPTLLLLLLLQVPATQARAI